MSSLGRLRRAWKGIRFDAHRSVGDEVASDLGGETSDLHAHKRAVRDQHTNEDVASRGGGWVGRG